MERIFKQLKFKDKKEFSHNGTIQETEWGFYIPGVNSGIYRPATLHITVRITKKIAKFFKFKTNISYSELTLDREEFDELFAEMEKIKKLRDANI